MASIYTETQLEHSDSIRILELSPIDTSLSTVVLHGRLIRADLDLKPDYAALSYVWGPPEYTHSITLNDSYSLPITETLFDALKELASDKANAGGLLLWIDQVCINQTDDSEKTSQVQMMSKIFSQAKLVIGWLGPADTDSNEAMDIFRYFIAWGPDKAKLGQDLCHRLNLECTTDQRGRPVNPLEQERNRAGLACVALLSRAWFRRLWIVQEIALAREVELRCGSATISDREFFGALISNEWDARNVVGSLSNTLTERISSLWCVKHNNRLSYISLAHEFQAWDCGYDHDRLTALYGIAQTMVYGVVHGPKDRQDPWFLPDYTISAMDLYYRFAKGYLQWHQRSKTSGPRGLEILHYAGLGSFLASHLPHSSGSSWYCPSWVPDWRIRNRTESLFSLTGSSCAIFDLGFRVDETSRTLTVPARPMSRISKVFQTVFSNTDEKIAQDIFALSERYTNEKMEEFVSGIFMGGLSSRLGRRLNNNQMVKIFEEWKKRHKSGEEINSQTLTLGESYTTGNVGIFPFMALDLCRNRSFFETEDGTLGVGPAYVHEGDSIYVIHGLATPFVMRKCTPNPTGNSWILMGDCYVENLMGQGWSWLFGSDQEITFV